MSTKALVLGDIITRPHSIFRDAETVDDRVDVLAECYADCRTWISEDSDELESLKKDVRYLKAELARMQKGDSSYTTSRKRQVVNGSEGRR